MELTDYRNMHEMLEKTVKKIPDRMAFQWFGENDGFESATWKEFYDQVKRVSKSLIALGVKKEDKVNVLGYTCYPWALADFGITSIGACTVGIYQSNLPHDCQYIIDHSESVAVFAENMVQLEKLRSIRDEIPNVRKVILFRDEPGPEDGDWVITFDEFLDLGENIPDEELNGYIEKVTPEDVAGIVYTSGTTGTPKGAVLTHDNVTFTAQSVLHCGKFEEGDETFLFLPLAHVFARTCLYTTIMVGAKTTFARGLDTLVEDFRLVRPHWFVSVPRIFEKVYSKVVSGVEAKGASALWLFNWARKVGESAVDFQLNNKPVPFFLNIQRIIAEKLIYKKLQEAFGGRVRWCISGAAPLNPDIARFFHACGIKVLEGIGMTENMSFSNVNRPDHCKIGTVGPPGPGIEQKIAEDGEIMFRGRNVMKEYFKMPDETANNITPEGWLHTGDLGEIDEDNFLKVTGRKKDLIITAGGKNIAPAPIEGMIAKSKYISQVCVIGDKRKFLVALVTLDLENIVPWAEENGIAFNNTEELLQNGEVLKLIESEIAIENKNLPSYETIKKVAIVPEFTIENKLLTPTLKLKKNLILEKYADIIEGLYPKN